MGLGFVPPLVMWRYDHLLPSALVPFVEAMLSLGVEGEIPASFVGTPLACLLCRGGSVPSLGFMMRGVKCGQRTGRWLVKTCQKLSLNSVCMILTRASGMYCWSAAWAWRRELTSSAASRSVASLNTIG